MGQVLPLPEKIPKPTAEQQSKLQQYGITVENTTEPYCGISLPDTHTMHDNSFREDLPEWYILRKGTNKACACIHGSWKVSYDNQIRLIVYDNEQEIERRGKPPIPSETSSAAILQKAVSTGDP